MKKFILSSILLLFIGVTFAQNALIWEVSGNGLEKPSYLFGTIHVICPDDFFIPEHLPEKLKSCEQLFLEIDMSDPGLMQKMQAGMINPQMKNIKADLSAEDLKVVDESLVKAMGAGIDQMGILKPWALSTMLSIKLGLDCQQPAQYETEVMKLANANEMPLKALETVEDQLAMFDKIPYEEQLQLLVDGAKDVEGNKLLFKKMVETYKAQDIDALYKFILEQDEMEDFGEFLLDKRNENWIPIITKAMGEKPSFIAVGAGHLGGEKGVISLLKAKGYTVEAVK